MSKIRKLLIGVLAIAATVCASIALAACDNQPQVKPPEDDGKVQYIVTLQSQGGMKLNDVKISAAKGGEVKGQGITVNGRLEFKLDPDEYELVIDEDTLPAGYVPPLTNYKADAENRTVTISLKSRVITKTAPAGTRYKTGDVMYDFEIADVISGETYKLSNLINTGDRLAVMINFFGTACNPCMSEFPIINKVYQDYKDKLEILAIANYVVPDTNEKLTTFKNNQEIGFPVSLDTPDLQTLFGGLGSWPTTVIVDRYGVIAEIATGANVVEAEWRATFNKYISDNYSQGGINPGEEGTTIVYTPRPDGYEMPDDAAIKAAIGDSNGKILSYNYDFTAENEENTWPWQLGGEGNDKYLTASNAAAEESFAIVNVDIKLNPLEGIAFDYNINTLSENNTLGVIMDDKTYFRTFGDSDGWTTQTLMNYHNATQVYYATSTRTVRLSFVYLKNGVVDGETPVSIRNIRVFNAAEKTGIKDFAVSVVDDKKLNANKSYNLNISKEDGLYYYNYTDESGAPKKSMLMVNVIDISAWTDIHYGKSSFKSPEEGSSTLFPASMYHFSYWYMSDWATKDEDRYIKIEYDPEDVIMFAYYLQSFSDNRYLPVNDKIKDKLIAFTEKAYNEYKDVLNLSGEWYEDQWYELCYYFRHLGAAHTNGEKCWETDNPVEGNTFDYAINAELGATEVSVTKILNLWAGDNTIEAGGGVKYKFTPDKNGVYCFYSTHTSATADPSFTIVDPQRQHIIAENDTDPRYDRAYSANGDALIYIELLAGQTYYITAAMRIASELGDFTMHIEYIGDYKEAILVATAGNGYWTWREDANGNPITDADGNVIFYYIAQEVALYNLDNSYWLKSGDNDYETPMYIDFIHQTYFDESGRSLKQLLDGNAFSNYLTEEETAELQEYCDKALAKDENAQLYGLWEAERDLVALLNKCLNSTTTTNDWQQAACFVATYGTKN